MAQAQKRSGTVRRIHLGPPLVLEVDLTEGGACRLEIPHQAPPGALQYLESEILQQTVEFVGNTVWYFRPVTEDDEVEYVYRVCLNSELERLTPNH